MSSPQVSIVLPTYNGSQFLEQSVQSCLAQTHSNWELIVVDDASTDETPEIVSLLVTRDPRVHAIRNETNRKLPGALNVGFGEVCGQYLTWTSDDNRYRPDAIARMVAYLDGHPKVDIVYTDYTRIDRNGEELGKVVVGEPDTLVSGNCVGACFLYRREVHHCLKGYTESFFLAEDYEFWLRAFCRFRLQPMHEDLYLYRLHPRSLTDRNARHIDQVVMRALEANLGPILKTHPELTQKVAERCSSHYRQHGYAALHAHDLIAAGRNYMRAVLIKPSLLAELPLDALAVCKRSLLDRTRRRHPDSQSGTPQ
jgi:glycosyltransferase involved in cell wall biosynthesis